MYIRIELLDIFHLNEIRTIKIYMVYTGSNCLHYAHYRYFRLARNTYILVMSFMRNPFDKEEGRGNNFVYTIN